MNRFSSRLLATLVVSLTATLGHARADYMNWSYTTSAVPPGFSATGANGTGSGTVQLTPYGTSLNPVAGGSSVNVLAYTTSETAPVTFDPSKSTYTLTMTITDKATNQSGSVQFVGAVGGNLNPSNWTLANSFTTTQQSVAISGREYTVTLPASMNLTASAAQQNITGTVSVSNINVAGVPEPASLMLGGLGFSLVGVGGWWKRLRRPAMQVA